MQVFESKCYVRRSQHVTASATSLERRAQQANGGEDDATLHRSFVVVVRRSSLSFVVRRCRSSFVVVIVGSFVVCAFVRPLLVIRITKVLSNPLW